MNLKNISFRMNWIININLERIQPIPGYTTVHSVNDLLYSGKFYEVQKYLSLTNHAYSALFVAMNKAKFDALSPAHQKTVLEAARETDAYQRQLNNKNVQKILAEVKKADLQVVANVDPAPFLEITKPVRLMFTSKFGGESYIKDIDAVRDTK